MTENMIAPSFEIELILKILMLKGWHNLFFKCQIENFQDLRKKIVLKVLKKKVIAALLPSFVKFMGLPCFFVI